ncbi:MAG: tetratricopeptide repeat protein [Chloroflexi bacterium]|nr:tetratricopeptide repeat protein [Chloroflexota bacterium]
MPEQIPAHDPQEIFHAGIERAGRHWLAFFQKAPRDPEIWARCGGHALRALIWCADSPGHGELATDLVTALESHVMQLGHWHEWESMLRRVIARVADTVDVARLWDMNGYLAMVLARMHQLDEAIALMQRSYEMAGARQDTVQQQGVLVALSEAYLNARSFDLALRCAEDATALAVVFGDPVKEADALTNAARALLDLGDVAEAQRRLERALALTIAAGSVVWEAKARLFLGHAAGAVGDWALALARFHEALPLVAGYHDEVGRATVLSNMGRALTELGRWDEATVTLEEAIRVLRYHGNSPAEAVARQRLETLQARRGG